MVRASISLAKCWGGLCHIQLLRASHCRQGCRLWKPNLRMCLSLLCPRHHQGGGAALVARRAASPAAGPGAGAAGACGGRLRSPGAESFLIQDGTSRLKACQNFQKHAQAAGRLHAWAALAPLAAASWIVFAFPLKGTTVTSSVCSPSVDLSGAAHCLCLHCLYLFFCEINQLVTFVACQQRKRLEGQWPSVAGSLLLRLPRADRDVDTPMFASGLAACVFQEYPVDTWQQARNRTSRC